MGVSGGPDIIQDGLVLALDASDKLSYPGSGTTWTDISGNNYNGTLTNGPTFSSTNGGAIVFDGTNDYVALNSNIFSTLSTLTITVWAYPKVLTTKGMFFKSSKASNNQIIFEIESSKMHWAVQVNGSWLPDGYSSASVVANIWQHFVVTVDSSGWKLYRNGVQDGSNTHTSNFTSIGTTQNYYIGYSPDGFYGDGRPLEGNIANTLIYNRALTATEILQNYNATKSRFGLT